jgi:putative membrane protein
MHGTRWAKVGLCAGLLLSGGEVLAQASQPQAARAGAQGDQQFLKQALGVNQLELQLGRLAADRGSTPEVKATGEKMVKNHTQLGQQLSDLSKQSGGSGKAELTPDQQATYARVASKSGSELDKAFKQTVDAGHVKELAMYQDEVNRASNPQLRALAEQRVTALQKAVGEAEQPKKPMQ